jgi:hypothetical protein
LLSDPQFPYESYIGRFCRVEFQYSEQPVRRMEYDGVVERVIRSQPDQDDHLVLNVRYGGRTQLSLNSIVAIEEIPQE